MKRIKAPLSSKLQNIIHHTLRKEERERGGKEGLSFFLSVFRLRLTRVTYFGRKAFFPHSLGRRKKVGRKEGRKKRLLPNIGSGKEIDGKSKMKKGEKRESGTKFSRFAKS